MSKCWHVFVWVCVSVWDGIPNLWTRYPCFYIMVLPMRASMFFFNIKFSESLHIMLLNMSFLVSGFVFVLFTVFCIL